jgi:hypothetical protein
VNRKQSTAHSDLTLMNVEFPLAALPVDMQRAITFARGHDRLVVIGYVEDEGKVYLQTVPDDAFA